MSRTDWKNSRITLPSGHFVGSSAVIFLGLPSWAGSGIGGGEGLAACALGAEWARGRDEQAHLTFPSCF